MRGHIRARGKQSWELKFEAGKRDAAGKRQIHRETFRGSRKDAERRLTQLLAQYDNGSYVAPNQLNLAEYLRGWLAGSDHLAKKTAERYSQLVESQIIPDLGRTLLQQLRPAQIAAWHQKMRGGGGKNGRPLSAQTVRNAHRVLHCALSHAVALEIVARNVCSVVRAPKVEAKEIPILGPDDLTHVLQRLEGHRLHPIISLAISTGLRRGEMLALQWRDIDLEHATLRVERSLGETATELYVKSTKTAHGRRTIGLDDDIVAILRQHRRHQNEERLALGLGAARERNLVFADVRGGPLSPDTLSRDFWRLRKALCLPDVSLRGMRHTHASVCLAARVDSVTTSRRLGHSRPSTTMDLYGHLFGNPDSAAVDAIRSAKRGTNQPNDV
jgi:integrase